MFAAFLALDFSLQNFGLHAPSTSSLGLQMEPSKENLWEILFLSKVEMKLAFLVCRKLSIYTDGVAVPKCKTCKLLKFTALFQIRCSCSEARAQIAIVPDDAASGISLVTVSQRRA